MAELQVIHEEDGFNLPPLGREDGSAFGWFDRWNVGTTPDGKFITDLSDWEARDMHEMLTKDYKSQQIENVLSLPITSAEYTIGPAKGDKGEAEWLNNYWQADVFAGGCRTSLKQIISLMTSAFYYKHAFFEKVFDTGRGQFKGKYVYTDVAWRPQTTCRLIRDPNNGRMVGFEQEAYYLGPEISKPGKWPIQIGAQRAFVYTHGTRRDPINGTSDMEVAFWAWRTKQKILMLWFQFLQSVSLPRVAVKAGDLATAQAVAREIARLKSSGVVPLAVPGGPDSVSIESLDQSGKGAAQFLQAIQWLDSAATNSVLAGFLDLTGMAAARADGGRGGNGGSYALSKDASDFFLQSLEAKAHEMEDQIRRQLFAPLIQANFGNDAAVPVLKFEPLNDIDKATAVELLKGAMAGRPGGPVPTAFIAGLAEQVAGSLGMDGGQMRDAFKQSFDAAAAEAKAQESILGAASSGPVGQGIAGMAGAAKTAQAMLKGGPMGGAAAALAAQQTAATKVQVAQTKVHAARQAKMSALSDAALKAKTTVPATKGP